MPTAQQTPAAQVAASQTSGKLLQLLRKRLRQMLRVTLVLVICCVLAASAFAIWWLTSLNGLPDIGDSFDVAAFQAFRVPDDQNAFAYLWRADKALSRFPALPRRLPASGPVMPWSLAGPEWREWVEANGKALELFQQAAEQPDGFLRPDEERSRYVDPTALIWLALLEGSRREERGEMAGAWDCYRAVVGVSTHIRRRGQPGARFEANNASGWLRHRIETWAAAPATTIPQVRAALEEVQKCAPRPEWDAFALKHRYVEVMRRLDASAIPMDQIVEDFTLQVGDHQIPSSVLDAFFSVRRRAMREPERSRRVLRLVFANWFAHLQALDQTARRPSVRASFTILTATNPMMRSTISVPLFANGPEAPSAARALPPDKVASWLVSTNDAKLFLSEWSWTSDRVSDLRSHYDLVTTLASALYHRESGSPPPSDEALVGTYLERLPDDGSADQDDGSSPRVWD
jgi:hypothetical protein